MTRADCRSRLMEVATELFAQKGFYGVSKIGRAHV